MIQRMTAWDLYGTLAVILQFMDQKLKFLLFEADIGLPNFPLAFLLKNPYDRLIEFRPSCTVRGIEFIVKIVPISELMKIIAVVRNTDEVTQIFIIIDDTLP